MYKEDMLPVQVYVGQNLLMISSLLQQRNPVQGLNPAYHYTEMKTHYLIGTQVDRLA